MGSGVVMASMSSARVKARNAARKAVLTQLRTALELYNGSAGLYPSTSGATYISDLMDEYPGFTTNGGNWVPGLAPTYIKTLPHNLGGRGNCGASVAHGAYFYVSDGSDYKLFSHCDPEGSWTSSDPFYDPARPSTSLMICSGGAACAW